jgi:hypothetical protein
MPTRKVPLIGQKRGKPQSPAGSVMVVTMMAVVVMIMLAFTILSISYSQEFNQRREQRSMLAFYAADAGINEAIARMNFSPSGASNDETEVKWDTGTNQPRNPASVRDPKYVISQVPDPDPRNYSDSTASSWRFWNYDPNWRYSGTSAGGEGNYPGATSAQSANLASAGRMYSYDSASSRTLANGANYSVNVVPHVRNFSGTWKFATERGTQAGANWFYYKLSSTGTHGGKTASIDVIVRKYKFGVTVPAAITAQGNVVVSGNGSVGNGDTGDEIPSGVAIQSSGTVTQSGSGTIVGTTVTGAVFPTFETIFGLTKAEMNSMAVSMGTAITTAPPSGAASYGQLYSVTPSGGSLIITGGGPGGYQLGSAAEPVILIVNGDLTLNSVTVYGIVYVTGAFRNQGASHIRGAILVEGTAETDVLGTGSEAEKIAYSRSVLDNVNNNQTLYPFTPKKGSWKINRG